MPYRITVESIEVVASAPGAADAVNATKLYEQTVAELDIRAVMAGVNKKPRKSRAKGAQLEPQK